MQDFALSTSYVINREVKMNIEINQSTFNTIKHIDEYGRKYWYERERQNILDYKEWRKFKNVINA